MNKELNERIEEIAEMYLKDLKPLREIGFEFGVSQTAIKKVLNIHGYITTKEALNLKVICDYCKKDFTKTRALVRKAINNFCSHDCYVKFLKELNGDNIIDRYGMSQSRLKVGWIYGELPEGSIVHHIDGNDTNILITNLMLLASQGDHIKIHRNYGNPNILFDGSLYLKFYPNLTETQIDQKIMG